MKVEDLKNLGLDDEQIKKVQALSGTDVTAAKTNAQTQIDTLTEQVTNLQEQVSQRDSDLSDVRTQLEQAGQSASKLGEVQKNLTSLQSKYDADTLAYKTKLADQEYEFKVRERANTIDFSCKAAKNEFISNLMKDRLPVKDGDLLGMDDYIEKQREIDPDAFKVVEDQKPSKSQDPNFAPPPNPNNPTPPSDKHSFGFNFTGVRKHD